MGIGIATRAVSPPQPRVDVETASNGGYGKVRVKDGGPPSSRWPALPLLRRGDGGLAATGDDAAGVQVGLVLAGGDAEHGQHPALDPVEALVVAQEVAARNRRVQHVERRA